MKKLILTAVFALVASLSICLVGCGQTNYYDVKQFMAMDSSSMVKALEQSGFEYGESSFTLMGVSGTSCDWTAQRDDILGDYKGTSVGFTSSGTGSLSKSDMEYADVKVGHMDIKLIGGSRVSDSVAPAIADKIMAKCGLDGSEYDEGKNLVDEWYREGICQIGGKDARWQIFFVNDSDGNYVSIDIDTENLSLISDHLKMMAS